MAHDDEARTDKVDRLVSLAEAATITGIASEALRLRIRRGKLPSTRGNDGRVFVRTADLDALVPGRTSPDSPETAVQARTDEGELADHLSATVAELRTDLAQARAELARAWEDRLEDKGRAERAEAQAAAWQERAEEAQERVKEAATRLDKAEARLEEARRPWWERAILAVRGH